MQPLHCNRRLRVILLIAHNLECISFGYMIIIVLPSTTTIEKKIGFKGRTSYVADEWMDEWINQSMNRIPLICGTAYRQTEIRDAHAHNKSFHICGSLISPSYTDLYCIIVFHSLSYIEFLKADYVMWSMRQSTKEGSDRFTCEASIKSTENMLCIPPSQPRSLAFSGSRTRTPTDHSTTWFSKTIGFQVGPINQSDTCACWGSTKRCCTFSQKDAVYVLVWWKPDQNGWVLSACGEGDSPHQASLMVLWAYACWGLAFSETLRLRPKESHCIDCSVFSRKLATVSAWVVLQETAKASRFRVGMIGKWSLTHSE